MKKLLQKTLAIVFVSLVIAGCQSTKMQPQPDWVEQYRTIYSEHDYIVQRGEAKSAAEAKNKAISAIAEYLSTEVHSRRQANLHYIQADGVTTENREIINQTDISSDIELSAVAATEPWRSKNGVWYCVAYLNRESAWKQHEPVMRVAKDSFYGYYNKAKEEKEPVLKIRYYDEALKAGADFVEKLSYAELLSARLTDAAYKDDLATISGIGAEQKQAKLQSLLYITVNDDVSQAIYSAVNTAFSSDGFIVTKSRAEAAYIVYVIVTYSESTMGGMTVISPSVRITLSGKSGDVYTFSASANRVNGIQKEIVKTKAAGEVAKVIDEKLIKNFNASMSVEK